LASWAMRKMVVYGINWVRHDKSRETCQRVVTRGQNIPSQVTLERMWRRDGTIETGYYTLH
jgi:hypothetical protein